MKSAIFAKVMLTELVKKKKMWGCGDMLRSSQCLRSTYKSNFQLLISRHSLCTMPKVNKTWLMATKLSLFACVHTIEPSALQPQELSYTEMYLNI